MTDDVTNAADDHGGHDHEHSATPCEDALKELYVYLDGELTEEKRTMITGHLDDCNPCLEAFDFEAELRMVISRRCHDDVPESLKLRIANELERQADQTEDA
ncbi:MAG: mycothiol system anti-sigma-R factor [Acidimicrobiales bacterium]